MELVGWSGLRDIASFCNLLEITPSEFALAEAESQFNYVQYSRTDRRTKKVRDLCYPPQGSVLRKVQQSIKTVILARIPLAAEIRGYRKGQHNILVAGEISGAPFEGRLDISRFHPSISDGHVANALVKHGIAWPWARRLARLMTFRQRSPRQETRRTVPVGAPTSSHVANIVLDSIIRRGIIPFTEARGVAVRNYGDDIAFSGSDERDVRQCVKHAATEIRRAGFIVNDVKTVEAEHRGGKRQFVGCATGRSMVDYPRAKYRALRRELRALLRATCMAVPGEALLSDRQINSLRQRIAYVGRLNKRKARRLRDLFYRICAQVRRLRLGKMPDPARGIVA